MFSLNMLHRQFAQIIIKRKRGVLRRSSIRGNAVSSLVKQTSSLLSIIKIQSFIHIILCLHNFSIQNQIQICICICIFVFVYANYMHNSSFIGFIVLECGWNKKLYVSYAQNTVIGQNESFLESDSQIYRFTVGFRYIHLHINKIVDFCKDSQICLLTNGLTDILEKSLTDSSRQNSR